MMFLPFGTNLLCMYVCSVAVEYTTYKPYCQVNYEKILNQMQKEPPCIRTAALAIFRYFILRTRRHGSRG